MPRHTFLILTAVFTVIFNTAFARSGRISGRVTDEGGKAIAFASVILFRAVDSTIEKTELTNERGTFELSPAKNGAFYLKVVFIGYDTYTSPWLNIMDSTSTLPEIVLRQNNATLKEATVSAQKPLIEVHPDKLVLNVENSIVSTGSSVLDVLQRSPGVTVDQNDVISLKGKQGVNVMIDGRIVPVSAADLANMLKSMPASTVDKIEIISNPSAKYDAAGTAGIINIKTKKDSRMGWNASINGNYLQGIYPKETAGFNINYRQKNFNVYASYTADYRTGFSHVDWDRKYYTGGQYTGSYVQDNYSVLTFHTNLATVGADYSLSSKTSVGFAVNGENFHLGTTGYYAAKVYGPDNIIDSLFATHNTSSGTWNNYAPNVHLKHTFDSAGKVLSIDGDYARYWNVNTQDFTTDYTLPDGSESKPPYILHADITGITQIRSIKADYENPLPGNARFSAGIKSSYVTADNQPNFYNRSSGSDVYDSTKSDHFLYSENINAAYLTGSKDWTRWSTQAGLRAEQTIVHGDELVTGETFDRNYIQLFPSFALQYHADKNDDIGLSLSRRIERPGYQDLNPYKFFVDPSTFKEGNPYLLPALTYAAELSYTYKQRLITTLSYSVTNNVITEVIKPDTSNNRVTIQTNDNLTAMHYIGISGAYTLPLLKWWTNITNINAYYARYEGNLSNTTLNAGKPTFDVNSTNKITLPKDWSAELSVFYQASQLYGFLNLTPVSMFNVGIQKNLLDRRLTIRAGANDIFWHGNAGGSSNYTNYSEVFTAVHDTRRLVAAVTYRFGDKVVSAMKHSGGAEEEKKRATERGT